MLFQCADYMETQLKWNGIIQMKRDIPAWLDYPVSLESCRHF